MMNTDLENHIAILTQTHPALTRLTAALSDDTLDFRATTADWSIREILAHLVDDEMYVMRTRLERMIKEEQPHLTPHDEKAWYANRNMQRDQVNELLGDFAIQRAASLGILQLLRASDWQREGYQPEYGAFTVATWVTRWTEHDMTHLQQIEDTLHTYHHTASPA